MKRIYGLALILLLTALAGCPRDVGHFTTQLPNGYCHISQEGHFGKLALPEGNGAYQVIVPKPSDRDAVGKLFGCDEFGWKDDYVVGDVIEYGKRAFIDPPVSHQFVFLDTTTGSVKYFATMDELRRFWQEKSQGEFPEMKKRHSSTISRE